MLYGGLLALALSALSLLIVGCGGLTGTDPNGPGGPGATGKGSVSISVKWPEATAEFIPSNAQSVKVVLREAGVATPAATRVIPRGMIGVTIDSLKASAAGVSYVITASAYPTTDGTGVAQSAGQTTLLLHSGENATAPVTMATTIATIGLVQTDKHGVPLADSSGDPYTEVTGFRVKWQKDGYVLPSAKDAEENLVLVAGWQWASSDPSIASVAPAVAVDGVGNPLPGDIALGKISGLAIGPLHVTATEADSGAHQEALVTVTGPTMKLVDVTKQYADPTHDPAGDITTADLTALSFGSTESDIPAHYLSGKVLTDAPLTTGPLYPTTSSLERYFYVLNDGGGSINWEAVTTNRWITALTPDSDHVAAYEGAEYSSGTDFATITNPSRCKVTTTRIGLCNGPHSGSITVSSNGGISGIGVTTSVPNGLAATGWPTLGGDLKHSGYSSRTGPGLTPAGGNWPFTTGDEITSPPAVAEDGTVYVGSLDGKMYAINPDGTPKWSYAVWYPIDRAGAAIDGDGNVYFGSSSGMVYSLTASGAFRWSYQILGGGVFSTPTVTGTDLVLVTSHNRKIYALQASNGVKVWEFATSDLVWASPALAEDGTVYITSADRSLYALNGLDGSLKWKYTTTEVLRGSPAIGADDMVYFMSTNGRVYAVRDMGERGDQMWYFWGDGGGYDSVAIGPSDGLYVGAGHFYRLSASNGNWQWDVTAGGASQQWTAPLVTANNVVYAGADNGGFYRFSTADGAATVAGTGGAIVGGPAIGPDGTVYVGSGDGKLYAFRG
jgi:outer membrane protein assembly factor BamB